MHGDCRNQDDWNHLCDYWESEKTRKYSDQMKLNRRKQVNISRGGSRSIDNHAFKIVSLRFSTRNLISYCYVVVECYRKFYLFEYATGRFIYVIKRLITLFFRIYLFLII
ncbi:putative transposase, Ptta/En/Spm, plant [Helianthus anomalus]